MMTNKNTKSMDDAALQVSEALNYERSALWSSDRTEEHASSAAQRWVLALMALLA